jgi:hypothetical protein
VRTAIGQEPPADPRATVSLLHTDLDLARDLVSGDGWLIRAQTALIDAMSFLSSVAYEGWSQVKGDLEGTAVGRAIVIGVEQLAKILGMERRQALQTNFKASDTDSADQRSQKPAPFSRPKGSDFSP